MKLMEEQTIKTKENLLFVGPYPPPYGGVSSHLFDINRGLKSLNYKCHILQFDSFDQDLDKDGAFIFKRATRLKFRFFFIFAKQVKKIITCLILLISYFAKSPRLYLSSFIRALHVVDLITKSHAERVVVYTTKIGALIPFVRILCPKIKIYYCIFADPYKNPPFYKKHKKWFKRAIENSEKVFSSSCYCSEAYGNFTKNVDPSVIYIGVDLERFRQRDPAISRKKISVLNRPTVLFLGRMEPEMGADNALEIAETVLSRNNNINFIIAGAKGSLTKLLEESAKKHGDNLIIRVNVSGDLIPYYYGAATVSIAPTLVLHACMGVSIKEAMASSRPTIASNSGGIPEAIRNDKEGYIIPLKNGDIDNNEFSNKIIDLISDQNRVNELSINARKRCEEIFSVEASLEKYINLFAEN